MKILLYQPDIAGNVGTIIRMCACLGLDLDIIELFVIRIAPFIKKGMTLQLS